MLRRNKSGGGLQIRYMGHGAFETFFGDRDSIESPPIRQEGSVTLPLNLAALRPSAFRRKSGRADGANLYPIRQFVATGKLRYLVVADQ